MHPDLPLNQILIGDCRELLKTLPDESVHCIVTSPPYWGLRSYGTEPQIWANGHEPCIEHQWGEAEHVKKSGDTKGLPYELNKWIDRTTNTCSICDAWRGELGLEPTPELYVEHLTQIFRECRRVLRDDGTLWLNLGDSYAARIRQTKPETAGQLTRGNKGTLIDYTRPLPYGLKEKDLVGIPWRVAFSLQQPYYTGRVKNELDRVWLAATLDAEGTICGFRHERDDGNVRSGILVFITNSDTRMLDHADRIWPGARYLDHNKEGDEVNGCHATRDCYRWQIQEAEERAAFISEIYPYLVSKKQQALIGWNMLQFAIAAKHMGRGGETGEIKDKRELLVRIISDLNHARPVVLPDWLKEPPSLYESGYYLRSDIIWSKSNPMPESVTDRPTKAHEYIFLLSKGQRYYYDSEAIREPETESTKSRNHYNRATPRSAELHHGKGFLTTPADKIQDGRGRNRRTVWTVATHPFSGAKFAADYVGVDGKPYTASPDCPLHGHLARSRKSDTRADGGQPVEIQPRTSGSGDGHDQESFSESKSKTCHSHEAGSSDSVREQTHLDNCDCKTSDGQSEHISPVQTSDHNSHKSESHAETDRKMDSLDPARFLTANGRSKRKSKTGRAHQTSERDSVSAQTLFDTPNTLQSGALCDSVEHTSENNTSTGDSSVRPLVHIDDRSVGKFSSPKLYCTCTITSIDHFATFPPKLIEPCILAGCPEGGTVLDPFMGSGTTASVCISLKRHYIGFDLNPAYVEGIAQDRADGTPPPLFVI